MNFDLSTDLELSGVCLESIKTYQLSQTYSGFWEPSVTKVSFWFKPRVKPD